jgi:hypothetical protein
MDWESTVMIRPDSAMESDGAGEEAEEALMRE